MSDFGQYLRELRDAQKLSLRDAAAKTGVSVSYIVQAEHGRRKPPGPDVIKKLAAAYNVPVKELMKAAGHLDDPKDAEPDSFHEQEVDRAFQFAITDPRFRLGTRIKGPVTTDVKLFVIEMYEKSTGRILLPGD